MEDDSGDGDLDRLVSVDCDEEERVLEWESGLPDADDLTPLSQTLITPEIAAAFRISPEPARTLGEVHRASRHTLVNLRRHSSPNPSNSAAGATVEDAADSSAVGGEDSSAKTLKRPRLVWTPQLHKRFVEVVAHLGIKNAVPKTIMQLMNVEGLTRENVASHLQKYRLYLKRMQGLSNEEASPSDHLFASTPVPMQGLHEQQVSMAMPYAVPTMIPMQVYGIGPHPQMGMGMGMGMMNNYHHQGQGGE
ncbi:transcription factor PCL1-like [Typha angustifolia]|uniref:transcription factor PCL1-like n=1 Tax=Typha angustifolia TaxID=59011 RepID=UPI003C2CF9F4